jgi:hypothetical protein
MRHTSIAVISVAALVAFVVALPHAADQHTPTAQDGSPPVFRTSDACLSCHTGILTPSGRDVSFGPQWRATMMANAARDPYWMAGVRREVLDHPTRRAEIENECSACHMPMARYLAKHAGSHGEVFANLPVGVAAAPHAALAADGVSCTLCHQIAPVGLGQKSSFTANFTIDAPAPGARPRIVGPFDVDSGRARIMWSSSEYAPAKSAHISESGVCASCHTLFTAAFGPGGEVVGELPEQVPYLEWEHSAYRDTRSCQSCHMPRVGEPVPLTPVLGEPRAEVARHSFPGGNFFMLRLLNRFRAELGVATLIEELDAAALRTETHLATEAASVAVSAARLDGGRLLAEVTTANLAGHKLPTAYPSRRAWLHVTVRDRDNAVMFESGAVSPDGRITSNDNDDNAARFEPHHAEITDGTQVQIYEAVLGDPKGGVTTGLLTAVTYLKDNRLLPQGFDKASAPKDVAVSGHAAQDDSFIAGQDRVRYLVNVAQASGPFTVQAELYYQSIGYRWAKNLASYQAMEPQRFVRFYDAMAAGSAAVLARSTAAVQ